MQVFNAMQLKAGAKAKVERMKNLTQPLQFLPSKNKDQDWGAWNMDWLEMQGVKQLKRNARRLLKNYKLANGIIDKTDYLMSEDNENTDLIENLTSHDETSLLELKFFPIVPNIVNVLVGEFSKRNDKVMYRSVDDISHNEMLEEKRSMIEQTLVSQAEYTMMETVMGMGLEMESEEAQQMMSLDNIKSLPNIEQFFQKDYKSLTEQWATHQHNVDVERFDMNELEITGFRDSLVTDREFWHFPMGEDDYNVELWNPLLTFYHKSPDVRYISQGNFVGKIELNTIPDVIDKYGYKMTKEQMESLESLHPVKAINYLMPGTQNDGGFYDATRSHKWNTEGASLGMRQLNTATDMALSGDDIITQILGESEDLMSFGDANLLRCTTAYWKTQRAFGHLTAVHEEGFVTQMIVDETYKITKKPIYDTTLIKEKSHENLIDGEHIDWIWINETWGGVKIGSNTPRSYATDSDPEGFDPIYLDVRPLKFQFKGDYSLYGCKLPVEGAVFSDRNSKSVAFIDGIKPYQIGFNMVNNQIADILIDEIGTVVLLDQNAIPKHSMGEDWGADNLNKAFLAMKDFQMLPLDTSISNTESALGFSHYQTLNLEQTNRLLGRIQLATYFKQQAYESAGLTPQRMGAVTAQETAAGVQQAVNASYSQTEMYFTQHSEHLMKRVHQMRTDLAQWYHSNSPSVRLQYMTSMEEKINFQINGTELLLKELNVFVTTKVNHKAIMEQIRGLALSNNTSGASIYDLGNLIKADSIAEISHVLKSVEEKVQKMKEADNAHQIELLQTTEAAETERHNAKLMFDAEQNELDRENNIDVAEVKGAGFQVGDLNNNDQSDYMDSLKYLDGQRAKSEDQAFQRQKEVSKNNLDSQKLALQRDELSTRKDIANKQLAIARTNKNKYDKK